MSNNQPDFGVLLDWTDDKEICEIFSDIPAMSGKDGGDKVRHASVLVPVFRRDNEWHVLYIRRVESERDRHSGQVAFPGGRRDEDDASATDTALREADEEIGLAPSQVTVLGTLSDYFTVSDYLVTPVVGRIPWPYDYQPQPSEVDRIFSIPLAWLCNRQNMQLRKRQIERDGKQIELSVVYFDRFDGELLWGATGRMTLAFLHALYRGDIVL